jgi:uncharacterized protein
MNKFVYKIIGITMLCVCAVIFYYRMYPLNPKVIIHDIVYFLDVAATDAEKEKGLGDRKTLETNRGMIFPYNRRDIYPFWMKGMNFPLDFLWIDGNIIVDITKNVPVYTNNQITTVRSAKPADKIIEFNAGFVDRNGINIGDAVLFKN